MLLTSPRFCGLFGEEFVLVSSFLLWEQLPLEPWEILRDLSCQARGGLSLGCP